MSSIGIIVKASQDVAELGADWVPQALGTRAEVTALVEQCIPSTDKSCSLVAQVEPAEYSQDPRSISISGVWGQRESAALRQLCNSLGARLFDAESGEFIKL